MQFRVCNQVDEEEWGDADCDFDDIKDNFFRQICQERKHGNLQICTFFIPRFSSTKIDNFEIGMLT